MSQELKTRSSVACGWVILIYEVLFCLRKGRQRRALLSRNLKCPRLDSTTLLLLLLANLAVVKVASCWTSRGEFRSRMLICIPMLLHYYVVAGFIAVTLEWISLQTLSLLFCPKGSTVRACEDNIHLAELVKSFPFYLWLFPSRQSWDYCNTFCQLTVIDLWQGDEEFRLDSMLVDHEALVERINTWNFQIFELMDMTGGKTGRILSYVSALYL